MEAPANNIPTCFACLAGCQLCWGDVSLNKIDTKPLLYMIPYLAIVALMECSALFNFPQLFWDLKGESTLL